MEQINITVTNGLPFNESLDNAILSITVTNTNAIPSKAGSNAYYYVTLSDGTVTENYTFAVAVAGTIPAATAENFVVENTTLGTVTTSTGEIYYTPA